MSNAGQNQTQSQGEEQKRQARRGSPGVKTMLVAGAGGLVTGAAVVGLLIGASAKHGDSELALVPQAEIAAAAGTLSPSGKTAYVEDAKACKVPLAYITVATNGAAATIHIRSGDYVSPEIRATSAPQRVAIPYPAPYPTGHGQISIEGEAASGASVSLYPTWQVDALHGMAVRNVVWTPKNPC